MREAGNQYKTNMKNKYNKGYMGSTYKKDLNFIQAFLIFIVSLSLGTLFIDFIGYTMWILSNQNPVDGFYVGRITSEVINLIM